MDLLWVILAQGAVVSALVDVLKKLRFVADHPMLVAAVLNLLALAAVDLMVGVPGQLMEFVLALAAAFSASVATHEVRP